MKLFQIPKHNYDGTQTTEHSFRLAYKNEQLHCRPAALAALVEHSCHLVVPDRERKLPKAHQSAQLSPESWLQLEVGEAGKDPEQNP